MSPREFTILVAGREELSRAMESALVERRRFSVVRAESAAEAVTLAGARALDLALLCDEPPENPGAALCGRLKQDRALAKLPVLIAGVRDGSAVEDAERNGAAAVLPASATMDRVLEAVSTLLGIPVRRPVRVAVVFNLEKAGRRRPLVPGVNFSVAGLAPEEYLRLITE